MKPDQVNYTRQLYAELRDYVKHEDSLINHRTTWLMTVQAFLIATFGFSYQKRFEVLSHARLENAVASLSDLIWQFDVFLIILSVVGIGTSATARRSVTAAVEAIESVDECWNKLKASGGWRRSCDEEPMLSYLPDITGGGNKAASRKGIGLSADLPLFFLILWIGFCALSLAILATDWVELASHPVTSGFFI